MFIVAISHEAGLFQFLAIKLILLSKGKPLRLLTILCTITIIISALLNNILTVIILIPLTITISRIINIDPTPYILTQAILVNIGGTLFSISSIPNILITTYATIEFLDFFLNVGLFALIIFGFTVLFFIVLYKKDLHIPPEGARVLKEFNVWNLVQNKRLLYESMTALMVLLILFVLIPSSFITPDVMALGIALILIVISRLEPKELISKIDLELIFYLLGIFIIAGAFEVIGISSAIGGFFATLSGDDVLARILLILWFSAFLSSSIDNIPITKVLIPVIGEMSEAESQYVKDQSFYSLAIGANWGDNLTPLGDNILVLNLAEQNKRPISFKQFLKLGFITTCYQLAIVSLIYVFVFKLILGLLIVMIMVSIAITIFLIMKLSDKFKLKLIMIWEKIRKTITG